MKEYLIIIIAILIIAYISMCDRESFINNLSIVDPYSLYLHKDISEKEDWWNILHTKPTIYF